jgi:hypothetical protein
MNKKNIPFIKREFENLEETIEGFYPSLLSNVIYGNFKGVSVATDGNLTCGNSKGMNVAVGINCSGEVDDYLIQFGAVNIVDEVNEDAFVFQLGIYNRAGDKITPIINVKGLGNLSKKLKRLKKNLENITKEE